MHEHIKKDKKMLKNLSNKEFERILTVCLLIGIITLFSFIIYYIATPEEGYVMFSYLNEDQEMGNYPTNATVDENITLHLVVGNYLTSDFQFCVKYGSCSNTTLISPTDSGSSNATLNNWTASMLLKPNQIWESGQINVSFTEVGDYQLIIFELWQILPDSIKFWTYNFIRLNITAP